MSSELYNLQLIKKKKKSISLAHSANCSTLNGNNETQYLANSTNWSLLNRNSEIQYVANSMNRS
jgi:hypothetical protein